MPGNLPSGHQPRLLVTGANGQLGSLVINRLPRTVPPARIAAMMRDHAAPLGVGLPKRMAGLAAGSDTVRYKARCSTIPANSTT